MATEFEKRSQSPAAVNVVLGVWLFISAFIWPHTQGQMTNTWIVGALCVVFAALAASGYSRMRYLNTILSIWLFISAWAIPSTSPGTMWNNVLVAIAIFVVSLLPAAGGHTPLRPHAP